MTDFVKDESGTWISDSRGNKCSVEYWGTEDAAKTALDSLTNCDNCTNCSGCSGCSYVANLYYKKDVRAVPADGEAEAALGAPIIPVIENIHQRVFEAASKPKALNMGDWHSCNTTHCRGGWVVHLAGEAGYALERFHNTALAAQLIYDASDPTRMFNPSRFFDGGMAARADMKRLAEEEAERVS